MTPIAGGDLLVIPTRYGVKDEPYLTLLPAPALYLLIPCLTCLTLVVGDWLVFVLVVRCVAFPLPPCLPALALAYLPPYGLIIPTLALPNAALPHPLPPCPYPLALP